ncbi:MAG: hypothetical protein ACYDA9_06995 [Terriglobia bacterium]
MTYEEMQQSLKELRDNQVVQGEIVFRVEKNLDRLEGMVEANTEAIAKLADGAVLLQSAMKSMVDTVDRFIRGMEGNGHKPGRSKH